MFRFGTIWRRQIGKMNLLQHFLIDAANFSLMYALLGVSIGIVVSIGV